MFPQAITFYVRTFGWRGLIAGIQALFTKVTGIQTYFMVKKTGYTKPFWIRPRTTDVHCYCQVVSAREYDISLTREPRVIIDGGANIGLASIFFANKYPHAKIIAIEPMPENFKLLERNVKSYANVVAVQAAIWNENSSVALERPESGGAWSWRVQSSFLAATNPSTDHVADGLTLDTIFERFGVGQVDLLKLDVEGAEYEILSDPCPLLDRVMTLVLEIHDVGINSRVGLIDFLKERFLYSSEKGENMIFHR